MTEFYAGDRTLFTVESVPPDVPAKPEEIMAWEAAVERMKESEKIN